MSKNHLELLKILKFFPIGKVESVKTLGQHKINDTYFIRSSKGKFVLQKMHPIFDFLLLYDIEKVTRHLHNSGLTTPLLIKTKNNKLGLKQKDQVWRVMTYIPGTTITKANQSQIKSAATLVGKFHSALSDLRYKFRFHIQGFHDTKNTIKKLEKILTKYKKSEKYSTLSPLAKEIIGEYKSLKKKEAKITKKRVIHDDLRIENIRFNANGKKAVCILDLDTLTNGELSVELGDIIRSWTNKSSELDPKNSAFDFLKYKAFLTSYLKTADFITKEELINIPNGAERLTLDLSARFLTDAFEEKYFRLAIEFKDLYTQNTTYANAQMSFYKSFVRKRKKVEKLNKKIANSLF